MNSRLLLTTSWLLRLVYTVVLLVGSSPFLLAQTVTTDKLDYAPGEIAIITGSGWTGDQLVDLHFAEDPFVDHIHDYHDIAVNSDGTFIKSRVRNSVSTEASGTFSFETVSGEKILTLTYKTSNSMIGSCTSQSLTESLWTKINNTNKMISRWAECDGPGLEYERVK